MGKSANKRNKRKSKQNIDEPSENVPIGLSDIIH